MKKVFVLIGSTMIFLLAAVSLFSQGRSNVKIISEVQLLEGAKREIADNCGTISCTLV